MTARAYWVHGVELVNCGADRCSACDRPAIGYINAHPICATHAGWAAEIADEYAIEVEASRARREQQQVADREIVRAVSARFNDAPVSSAKGRAYRAGNHRAAAEANRKKSEQQRLLRHAAILGALGQLKQPQSVASLALQTGLSRAGVQRTLRELSDDRQITMKRAHKSSTMYFALRRAS